MDLDVETLGIFSATGVGDFYGERDGISSSNVFGEPEEFAGIF
jgi:hypothetical protein